MIRLEGLCLDLLRIDTLASISARILKLVTVFLLTLASQMYFNPVERRTQTAS